MQIKSSINEKFAVMGFHTDNERVIFEQRLNFDYTLKPAQKQPILANNTKNIK